MFDIYKVSPLLNHTMQIECIASYDDHLLIGTRQGVLLMYKIDNLLEEKPDIQLKKFNKAFSKKAIQQLEVIPELKLLICLTDNLVQIHDITVFDFQCISTFQRSKGATLFTLDILKKSDNEKEYRLCIVVKRKLQLYIWERKEFVKLKEDINLPDTPKSVAWCENAICVGYKGEYTNYDLDGKRTELFPISSNRSIEPYVIKVSNTSFAMVRENQTVFINDKGRAEINKPLKWSSVPTALSWDAPYCLALLDDGIEIQTTESEGLIQSIKELNKVRFISLAKQGFLYVSSISQVWILQAVDIAIQRKFLLENKQFQLALRLTTYSDETEEDKNEIIYDIQTLLAYDLFNKKQFTDSMKEFLKLSTNPSDVIRLFPDLLPQQSGTNENESACEFTDKELEKGLQALIEYLTEVRLQHQLKAQKNATGNLNEQSLLGKSNQQLLQIIDTTLLKCYLQTNDALVAPLLRSNHCHLSETEKTLKKYGKHNELIILYQTKGQHRRALELLQSQEAVDKSIDYLQHLGVKDISLILEFSDWILKSVEEEGLRIFTEDLPEVESLPRPRILDHLLKYHTSLVIPYLEHVVLTWEDTNPLFHNALIHKYREKAVSDEPGAPVARKKLIQFLEKSEHYKSDTVLGHFPCDSLLEERAIILGKIGQHEQALDIYVRGLGDIGKAVNYCNKVYNVNTNPDVFISLIKLVLEPNSTNLSLPGVVLSPKTAQRDVEKALELMEEYAHCINPEKILQILPDNISVVRIHKFLQVAWHEKLKERRRLQVLKSLLYAEHLQCTELRLHLESQSILITDYNICPVCKKRFSNQSALVRYANGSVVHYSCQDKKF